MCFIDITVIRVRLTSSMVAPAGRAADSSGAGGRQRVPSLSRVRVVGRCGPAHGEASQERCAQALSAERLVRSHNTARHCGHETSKLKSEGGPGSCQISISLLGGRATARTARSSLVAAGHSCCIRSAHAASRSTPLSRLVRAGVSLRVAPRLARPLQRAWARRSRRQDA